MNITKLNKQLKAHIKQEISERAGYLYTGLLTNSYPCQKMRFGEI